VNVEIDDDYVDNIVAQSLRECYENMVYVGEQQMKCPHFSHDREWELERTYELRKALRLVINHYSTYENRIPHPEEWQA
jgi:hypothetical protein